MFRSDARGHGDSHGMWAPEDGRGSGGGAWGALVEGGERESGGGSRVGGAFFGGDEQDQEGPRTELLLADDLDFQIASY